jgi:competence protein ComEC
MERARAPTRRLVEFFQRRPAIIFLILLVVGIALTRAVSIQPWIWLGIAAGLVGPAILFRWLPARILLLGCAIILVGLSAGQIERYQFPADTIVNYTTDQQRFAELELAIGQTPRLMMPSPGELRSLPPKQTTVANVTGVKTTDGWRPCAGKIAVTIEQPNLELREGEIVRVAGMLERPSGAMNPGEFDYLAWCREERILATFRVEHADGVQIVSEHFAGPVAWARDKARHLLGLGFNDSEAFDQALLRAFVFGDPDPQLRDVDDEFVRTGAIHYLAITGLHVGIIGAMALLVCRLLRTSPRTAVLSAMGVVLLYGLIADPTWPGWRSVIFCAVATIGVLGRREMDSLQIFFASAAVILLIHPGDLTSGGFQVSFAAVLGLILFARTAEERLRDWWRGEDAAARNFSREGAIGLVQIVWRFVLATLVASCVAWAMSMPLVAYQFGQLNSWAIPIGVVLVPLTVIGLYAGMGKILLTLLWPSGAHGWAVAASLPVMCMRRVIETVDRLPGANVAVWPPLWLLVVYYGLVLLVFLPIRGRLWRWATRAGFAAACVGMLVLLSISGGAANFAGGHEPARITLLSVGAGQCAIVRIRPDHAIFIDAGSDTISDVGRQAVIPWLRTEHCGHVDGIFLSHGG